VDSCSIHGKAADDATKDATLTSATDRSNATVIDPPDRYDVFVQGTVFLDIVLTGLESAPATGTEIFAEGMGSCPGGVANFAIAASRLGLKSGLAAVFGDDVYADF